MGPELVSASTAGILDDTKFMPFWLSWANGTVKLGRGKVVGENGVLEYKDPLPLPVNYLAFAGWDYPGTVLIYPGIGGASTSLSDDIAISSGRFNVHDLL